MKNNIRKIVNTNKNIANVNEITLAEVNRKVDANRDDFSRALDRVEDSFKEIRGHLDRNNKHSWIVTGVSVMLFAAVTGGAVFLNTLINPAANTQPQVVVDPPQIYLINEDGIKLSNRPQLGYLPFEYQYAAENRQRTPGSSQQDDKSPEIP